jgi:hypothetical protein
LFKKILENLGMKKPAKAAAKKVLKQKTAQKPLKKIVKAAPKKAVAPKAKLKIKPKILVKTKLKVQTKKPMLAKKPLKKALPAKKVAVKAPAIDKKKAKQLKFELIKKNQKNLELQKVVAKKAKEAAKKAKDVLKSQQKSQKENEKKLKQKEKEQEKEAEKLAKVSAKEAAKKAKMKGKKGNSYEEEEELEGGKPRVEEEDDDDDFTGGKPVKVKMTFDEEFDEEVIPVKKKKSGIDDNIKDSLAEEILALTDEFSMNDVFASIRSMELFKLDNDECVVRGCDNPSTTNGYCRYHYLKLWKDVKKKEQILQEGKLAKIIEDLVRKYPMKYVEAIVQDLADDKSFNHVLKDLDIETEEADLENFDDEDLLDDDQDIAFETKVVKPSFDDN